MLFQANRAISLISSGLMFLTDNTLCTIKPPSRPQRDYNDPTPTLVHPKRANKYKILDNILFKNLTKEQIDKRVKKLHAKMRKYKAIDYPTDKQDSGNEVRVLYFETLCRVGRGAYILKADFTKENYEDFLRKVDFCAFSRRTSVGYRRTFFDEYRIILFNNNKELLKIPKLAEKIFTADVTDDEEKKRRKSIIEEVNKKRANRHKEKPKTAPTPTPAPTENKPTVEKPNKQKGTLKNVLLWSGVTFVVLLFLGLVILTLKRRGALN